MRLSGLLFCICLHLSCCGQRQSVGDTIVVDKGVEVPIQPCVEANAKVFGKSINPVEFCKCLLPKFYEDLKNDPEKLTLLKKGNWYDLSNEKQQLVVKYYDACISQAATNDSTAKLTFTPRMVEGIKQKMKRDLVNSDIQKTNNIDKYCDCLIGGLQTEFTATEITQTNFSETDRYQKLLDTCLKATRK